MSLALASKEIHLVLLPGNSMCQECAVGASPKPTFKCCVENWVSLSIYLNASEALKPLNVISMTTFSKDCTLQNVTEVHFGFFLLRGV